MSLSQKHIASVLGCGKKGLASRTWSFSREPTIHFSRWCLTSNVDDFDSSGNLVILEQFKNSLPSCIATYLTGHKVTSVTEAVGLAAYVLIHKSRPW